MKTFLTCLLLSIGIGSLASAGESSTVSPGPESDIDAPHLWAQTCQRCHNLRPATAFNDAQLQVIMHHMRLRANLTGEEARAILQFLKEAN